MRGVVTEFSAGDSLDHAVYREQAADSFAERILAKCPCCFVELEWVGQSLVEFGGH